MSSQDTERTQVEARHTDEPVSDQAASLTLAYDRYSGAVASVAGGIVRSPERLEEAVLKTFATAWEAPSSFTSSRPLGPWMFTLARRTAVEVEGGDGGTVDPPSIDRAWEVWEIRTALDALSETESAVVRLEHFDRLLHAEIAARLRVTVASVKSHSYRGHRQLVQDLAGLVDNGEVNSNNGDSNSDSNSNNGDSTDTDTNNDTSNDDGVVVVADGLSISPDDPAERESARSWYLAGIGDGSSLDPGERDRLARIRTLLTETRIWARPGPELRERVLADAAGLEPPPSAKSYPAPYRPDPLILNPEASSSEGTADDAEADHVTVDDDAGDDGAAEGLAVEPGPERRSMGSKQIGFALIGASLIAMMGLTISRCSPEPDGEAESFNTQNDSAYYSASDSAP